MLSSRPAKPLPSLNAELKRNELELKNTYVEETQGAFVV